VDPVYQGKHICLYSNLVHMSNQHRALLSIPALAIVILDQQEYLLQYSQGYAKLRDCRRQLQVLTHALGLPDVPTLNKRFSEGS